MSDTIHIGGKKIDRFEMTGGFLFMFALAGKMMLLNIQLVSQTFYSVVGPLGLAMVLLSGRRNQHKYSFQTQELGAILVGVVSFACYMFLANSIGYLSDPTFQKAVLVVNALAVIVLALND